MREGGREGVWVLSSLQAGREGGRNAGRKAGRQVSRERGGMGAVILAGREGWRKGVS